MNNVLTLLLIIILIISVCSIILSVILSMNKRYLEKINKENQVLKSQIDSVQKKLDEITKFDPQTNLFNVDGIRSIFEQEIKSKLKDKVIISAALIQITNLENILKSNDSEFSLNSIVQKIRSLLRSKDYIARIGINDFLVFFIDTELSYSIRIAQRIIYSLNLDNSFNSKSNVAVGVIALDETMTFEEMTSKVNRAAIKSIITGSQSVGTITGSYKLQEDDSNEEVIETICDGENLSTLYQPIIELDTLKRFAYELYARGPSGEYEFPDRLFKLSAKYNVLTKVDLICLRACVENSKKFEDSSQFHINLFPSTLIRSDITTIVNPILFSGSNHRYCIEISQNNFILEEMIILQEKIKSLREQGIMIAIDDVGIDTDSIQRVLSLEPDYIKLAKSFSSDIIVNPENKRLLIRLINLAKSIGSEIIAEGVETLEEKEVLQQHNVKYGQGYYFGRPQSIVSNQNT